MELKFDEEKGLGEGDPLRAEHPGPKTGRLGRARQAVLKLALKKR